MGTTRFERDIKRRTARIVPALFGIIKRLDFRVRQTSAPMPAAPDDFTAFHQNRANHRIGRSQAVAAPGEPEGVSHEVVTQHLHAA